MLSVFPSTEKLYSDSVRLRKTCRSAYSVIRTGGHHEEEAQKEDHDELYQAGIDPDDYDF